MGITLHQSFYYIYLQINKSVLSTLKKKRYTVYFNIANETSLLYIYFQHQLS